MGWRHSLLIFGGLAFAACGSGQPPNTTDAGDAGLDAGMDAGALQDGGDAGVVDAGPDAGIDAGPVDAGIDAGPTSPYGHDCSSQQDATGFVHRTGAIGGDQTVHDYYTYVPLSYDGGTPIALVVSLHGAGDTATNFLQLWQTNADQKGFMVLLPEASSPLAGGFTWNIADTHVVYGAIADIEHCYNTELHHHILHGFSAGGIIAYIVGLSQADRFSGLAIASSDLGTAEYYHGGRLLPSAWAIPASIFHGEQDPNFPFVVSGEGSRDALVDAGHVVYFHPFMGGHTSNAADSLQMYEDLKDWASP
jgi:poly(3-hydroxybutyrate) depolymerase